MVTFEVLTAVNPSKCFVLVREGLMIWYREWEFLGAFEKRLLVSSYLSVRPFFCPFAWNIRLPFN